VNVRNILGKIRMKSWSLASIVYDRFTARHGLWALHNIGEVSPCIGITTVTRMNLKPRFCLRGGFTKSFCIFPCNIKQSLNGVLESSILPCSTYWVTLRVSHKEHARKRFYERCLMDVEIELTAAQCCVFYCIIRQTNFISESQSYWTVSIARSSKYLENNVSEAGFVSVFRWVGETHILFGPLDRAYFSNFT
jgi:hypothetical protein